MSHSLASSYLSAKIRWRNHKAICPRTLAGLDRTNERSRLCHSSLWPLPQPAFEGEGFTRHILKIRGRQLNADASDFLFSITEVTDWRNVDVGFKGVREGFFELFQFRRPGQWADDVYVDVILSPFGSGDPAQAPNPFLCRRVGTLPVVAEKPGTRGKVDYGTLAFLEQRITGLHVVEGSVEARINGEVELVASVVSQGDAGSRSLSIVNQNVPSRRQTK